MGKRDKNHLFASFIRSLHLVDGDVLLVQSGATGGSEEDLKLFAQDIALALKQALGDQVPKIVILTVDDIESIRKLDRGFMRQLGWIPISEVGQFLQRGIIRNDPTQ